MRILIIQNFGTIMLIVFDFRGIYFYVLSSRVGWSQQMFSRIFGSWFMGWLGDVLGWHPIMYPKTTHWMEMSIITQVNPIRGTNQKGFIFLDLLVWWLGKIKTYSPNGGEKWVMNPMVQSVKKNTLNKQTKVFKDMSGSYYYIYYSC